MTRKLLTPLLFVLILAYGGLAYTLSTGNSPTLGLDLQGGFSVVLTAQGNPPEDSVEKAKDIIRQRIDGLGVAEPEVTRQGNTVLVQLPGVKDREKAQQIVGQTAKLEFRPVLADPATDAAGQPYFYDAALFRSGEDPCTTTPPADLAVTTTTTTAPASTSVPGSTTTAPGGSATTAPAATASTAPTTAAPTTGDEQGAAFAPPAPGGESAGGILPRQEDPTTTTPTTAPATPTTAATPTTTTTTTTPGATPTGDGTLIAPIVGEEQQPGPTCVQLGPVGFDGSALSSASAVLEPNGQGWQVNVKVKGDGKADANAAFNACFAGGADCPTQRIAIVLDGVVQSAPVVQDQNLADNPDGFVISGDFTQGDAKDLALVLRYGALPVEFERSAEQQVSATLGRDSLHAGIVAGIIGFGLVALYMLLYYRALGMVVVVGLSVWGSLMYTVVTFLSVNNGLTLSLSGVVGIIVSIGTTVDSYVVYFERLKDEVKSGKTVRSSTERGFRRAFRTILTANTSSLIGAAVLWWLTVGPVRGFAFFLGLSVLLDTFVAYFFTRPTVALLARNRFFTEARWFGVARGLGRGGATAEVPS